jgi:hypothetical protein
LLHFFGRHLSYTPPPSQCDPTLTVRKVDHVSSIRAVVFETREIGAQIRPTFLFRFVEAGSLVTCL